MVWPGAAQQKPAPDVSATAVTHLAFPAGGTLHLERSMGEVIITGWDRSDMEMTVSKAPPLTYNAQWRANPAPDRELQKVQVTAERQGNEVVVRTAAPRRAKVWVEYHIRVPRSAGLVVRHNGGEVHVADLTGDIHATTREGQISLLLPADGQYAIDARTDWGNIYSDFPGAERRRFWLIGHRFAPEAAAGHKLFLRVGYGDIIIQKIRRPAYPAPLATAGK